MSYFSDILLNILTGASLCGVIKTNKKKKKKKNAYAVPCCTLR
jgi:hypothetical protein